MGVDDVGVLLSGGVDSSVALLRLREQGYRLSCAYYLKIWLEDELTELGSCPWAEDLKVAEEVCKMAQVPLKVISLQQEYHREIISYCVEELQRGGTPTPDLLCNRRIKFGAFFRHLPARLSKIATGHYGIIEMRNGRFFLRRASDPVKDQSYFLSQLSQEQLGRLLFPLGELGYKSKVREEAYRYGLPNWKRKDSQGLCFLGKIRYEEFIRHYLGEKEGKIVEEKTGKILGKHRGYWFHTIGQRRGVRLGGGPWYVTGKDVERNLIYVSTETYPVDEFIVENPHWITTTPSFPSDTLSLKLRHGPALLACRVTQLPNGSLDVKLLKGDQGVATGQHAVFYDEDYCLGGGRIKRKGDAESPPLCDRL